MTIVDAAGAAAIIHRRAVPLTEADAAFDRFVERLARSRVVLLGERRMPIAWIATCAVAVTRTRR